MTVDDAHLAPDPTVAAPFVLSGALPAGSMAIEASAGTGKTYALAGLATRYVVEVGHPIAQVLLVTFTRAAASELSSRVRARLVETTHALSEALAGRPAEGDELLELLAGPTVEPGALEVRLERARRAVAEFDGATISTIHGFAQQMLRTLGAASGCDPDAELDDDGGALAEQVTTDVLVRAALGSEVPAEALDRERVTQSVAAVLANAGVRVTPESDGEDDGEAEGLVSARRRLVDEVLAGVATRRRAAQQLSFDDLLTSLRDVVAADTPAAEAARAALRRRFRVALIDEFQDTDPVQWEIFDRIFGGEDPTTSLVLVGDPKQAIYGFRGADVHTYQRAVDTIRNRFSLDTNWRSDGAVLDGVGALLEGLQFGHPSISFRPVVAAERHLSTRITVAEPDRASEGGPAGDSTPSQKRSGAGAIAPVALRIPAFQAKGNAEEARRSVTLDLARYVDDLLARAEIPDGGAGERRRLRPADVAVLVRGKAEAPAILAALRRRGIDAVFSGVGSVLDSPAALQWRWLLEAVAQPFDARRARAATLSWFVGWSAKRLDTADEQELGAQQEQFQRWGEVLVGRGIADFVRLVRGESAVVDHVLATLDGERNITDIDHIGELLIRNAPRNVGPAGLLRMFDQLAAQDTVNSPDHPAARRIESERDAVTIMTAHSSKGLEFPVVCLPMYFKPLPPSKGPVFYSEDSIRSVDIAWDLGWPDKETAKARKALGDAERHGEALRLVYVAMTRARHHLALWWQPYKSTSNSPLSKVLFSRDDAGDLRYGTHGLEIAKEPSVTEVEARLARLVERGRGNLSVEVVDVVSDTPVRHVTSTDVDAVVAEELELATMERQLDRRAVRTSFSSLTRSAHGSHLRATDAGGSAPAIDPSNELGTVGGTDEGPEVEPVDPLASIASLGGPATDGGTPALPLAGFGGANRFGTLVHDILEVTDFAHAELDGHLAEIVARATMRSGLDLDPVSLATALGHCLNSPLGEMFNGIALRDLSLRDRLNEMRFQLNLGLGTSHDRTSDETVPVPTAGAIGTVICRHLGEGDPLRPWAEHLSGALDRAHILGYLEGFVDLIARVPNGDGTDRFIVVDYKTNNLTPHGAEAHVDHYAPERLVAAMADHHYPLQALLYEVALHRYLRHRVAGYRPEVNLGGIGYLFVRGMVGPETRVVGGQANGVFAWQPPVRLIADLSDLLDGTLEAAP